jgi:hypothetical protein
MGMIRMGMRRMMVIVPIAVSVIMLMTVVMLKVVRVIMMAMLMIVIMVMLMPMTIRLVGIRADAFDVMMMALLRQTHLSLEAQHLGAVFA